MKAHSILPVCIPPPPPPPPPHTHTPSLPLRNNTKNFIGRPLHQNVHETRRRSDSDSPLTVHSWHEVRSTARLYHEIDTGFRRDSCSESCTNSMYADHWTSTENCEMKDKMVFLSPGQDPVRTRVPGARCTINVGLRDRPLLDRCHVTWLS